MRTRGRGAAAPLEVTALDQSWFVLDPGKAGALEAAVRRVLREAGMWVHHPAMLEALAAKGAQVDAAHQQGGGQCS